jgi:hypothetical protein
MPCCSKNEASTSSSSCVTTNLVEEIKELKAQVTSLEKELEKRHEGKSTLDNIRVCKNPLMTRVDLDSTPITRTSPRATRRRRAKTKSRIWPRLFASSAREKGLSVG